MDNRPPSFDKTDDMINESSENISKNKDKKSQTSKIETQQSSETKKFSEGKLENSSRESDSDRSSKNNLRSPVESQELDLENDIENYLGLSSFKRDLLFVLSSQNERPKGLEIKEKLEEFYQESVNHGRLYPNLDSLADEGLIEKVEVDKRTNGYNLSTQGTDFLKARYNWVLQKITTGDMYESSDLESEDTANSIYEVVNLDELAELSAFQIDILMIVATQERTPKGLKIKEKLEDFYEEDVNHGRLYPNLDNLVEDNLIEKIEIDKRSNGYNLTRRGSNFLKARYLWISQKLANGQNKKDKNENNANKKDKKENKSEKESKIEFDKQSDIMSKLLEEFDEMKISSQE